MKVKSAHEFENVAFLVLKKCTRINAFATKLFQHVDPLPVMVMGFDKMTVFI